MRRTLAATLLVGTALFLGGLTSAASASGFCGGGEPGGPCYCPDFKVIKVYC